MAYTRSLSTRRNLIGRRINPSFCYILHDYDHKQYALTENPPQNKVHQFIQQRSFGSSFKSSAGFGRWSHLYIVPSTGASFCRCMSTTNGEVSDKIELISDVAEVLSDPSVQEVSTQVPVVNEVAVAAADSFLPVAALQYFIDYVHTLTGFNWWASIIVSTIVIRWLTLPLLINQLKATSKLTLLRPHLEELKQEMQDKGMDPTAVAEGQKKMQKLFKEYGVSPFTPLKGLFIQGPVFISFFLAISNMAEKVPSFKSGGAYWFLDLTTPDNLYILPFLTALSFLVVVESNMQEGLEGNPAGNTMKNVSRGLAVLSVPLTMSFPKAIFCYWITSNLFSLTYGLVLKIPGVKTALGVPDIPKAESKNTPKSSFDLFAALKQHTAAKQIAASSTVEPSKPADRRVSSSSVMSQRLRSLEKQVKGKKKNKKT
ncbi:60KD_IMP domain-containing protein [Cephalotus follicularis]|uniref:60KD_IMP domain-containing protein n=1 Tax=Cephalotus follicularis TaxID=3775 RepID=A0A1Q3BCN1_CEPFO|nr:60KD_IMP domain-containing protein [Cephalotus follicularis]